MCSRTRALTTMHRVALMVERCSMSLKCARSGTTATSTMASAEMQRVPQYRLPPSVVVCLDQCAFPSVEFSFIGFGAREVD